MRWLKTFESMSNDGSDDLMIKYFGVDKEYLEACAIDLIDEGIDINFDEGVLWSSYEYLENLSKLPYQRDAIPCLKFKMSVSDSEVKNDETNIRKKIWKFFTRLNKNGLKDIGIYDDVRHIYVDDLTMKDGRVYYESYEEDVFMYLLESWDSSDYIFLIVGKEQRLTWKEFLEFYGVTQEGVPSFDDVHYYLEISEESLNITTKSELYYHLLNLTKPNYRQYEPLIELDDTDVSADSKRLISQVIASVESEYKQGDIDFMEEILPDIISNLYGELYEQAIVDSLMIKLKKIIEKLLETEVNVFTSNREELVTVSIKDEHIDKCFEDKVLHSQSKMYPSSQKFDLIGSIIKCALLKKRISIDSFYPEIDWLTLKRTFNENLTSILKNYMSK